MPDLLLDLRLFRYAMTAADHGSFRRAAAALNVQQSTVSKGIRNLEDRLGAMLFERSHSGIRPTLAGDRFLNEASLGFDCLEKAIRRIGSLQRGEHGELAVVTSVPFALLGEILERFREQYHCVSVEIMESTCSGSCASVRQRQADIAFVVKPAENDFSRSLHLFDESTGIVLPASHRLAKARAVMLEDVLAERLILGASGMGPEIGAQVRRRMTKLGPEPNIQFHRVGQYDLVTMVARGFGVTIIAGRLQQSTPDSVVLVPLSTGNVFPVYAVWVDANPNPALKGLLNIVEESAPARASDTGFKTNN